MINIVKNQILYEASGKVVSEVGACCSDLSLFFFFKEDDQLKLKSLFKNEMISANGFYQGSLYPGRWSPTTELTMSEDDSNPVIYMRDGEVKLALWMREGKMVSAPSVLKDSLVSVSGTKKIGFDESFTVDFNNFGGIFSGPETVLGHFFEKEKSAAIYLGYDEDLICVATAQVDSSNAVRDPDTASFSVPYRNKYAELIKLPMSKRYGRIYPPAAVATMITGLTPDKPIAVGATIELKIDCPAPARWCPGSVQVEIITYSNQLSVVGPYGQSETMAFLRITNNGSAAVTPSINIKAGDYSEFAVVLATDDITISNGQSSANKYIFFDKLNGDPFSYQVYVTAVSGIERTGHWPSVNEKTIDFDYLKANYHPQFLVFDPAANGTGVEVKLYDSDGLPKNISGDITISFQVLGRELNGQFGRYHTAAEVLFDLAKMASRKELKLGDSADQLDDDNKKLAAGEFSKQVFVRIEEGFNKETVRVVNTTDATVNIDLIEIFEDDVNKIYGVTVAVTRAFTSLFEKEFSFQIWGQYENRTDFLMPLNIEIPESMDVEFKADLSIIDSTIEDAFNQVLQICFDEEDSKHKLFFGDKGQIVLKPYKIGEEVLEIRSRNMGGITTTKSSPTIIDRLEVKGKISELFINEDVNEEVIDNQYEYNGAVVPSGVAHNNIRIEFDGSYDKHSLRIEELGSYFSHAEISERNMTYCVVKVHNDTKSDWGKNNYKATWLKFKLYGKPYNAVSYQEDYTYKTLPGSSGRYTHAQAEVNNPLITDPDLANRVANSMVLESANEQQVTKPETIPGHPELLPLDTVRINFNEHDLAQRVIVDEINYTWEVSDAPQYLMNISAKPFDLFATESGNGELKADGDMELDGDTELRGLDLIKVLLKLFFG